MTRLALIGAAACVAAAAGAARAQTLAERVVRAGAPRVRLAYAARPGVCGDGEGRLSVRDDDGSCACAHGPVRVTAEIAGGAVRGLTVRVGPARDTAGTVDLGPVPAAEAARWLLDLARTADAPVAERAIMGAVLADSVTAWPELLRIAKDGGRPERVRASAVFWVGQAAADSATRGLVAIVGTDTTDREVRSAALFAISQQRSDVAVPTLIAIARSNRDPEIRRRAMFWLGQSRDPRALAFFEEVLAGR